MASILRLYWWSEIHIQKKSFENYGDLLGKYLAKKISGKNVIWVRANKFYFKNLWRPVFVTIGSVLEHIGSHCIVWGSGIAHRESSIARATFMAVRGPLSRKRILDLGYDCPEVYGDPALLLPLYYQPNVEQTWEIGIVPHISDYNHVVQLFDGTDIKIIDFNTNSIEQTTKELVSCKRILSSSLHGLIVAHAYQIPAVQVNFSDKIYGDGIKYFDYFQSVGLQEYAPVAMSKVEGAKSLSAMIEKHAGSLPDALQIEKLQQGLLKSCPFKAVKNE